MHQQTVPLCLCVRFLFAHRGTEAQFVSEILRLINEYQVGGRKIKGITRCVINCAPVPLCAILFSCSHHFPFSIWARDFFNLETGGNHIPAYFAFTTIGNHHATRQ
jgi:hypothetical protein